MSPTQPALGLIRCGVAKHHFSGFSPVDSGAIESPSHLECFLLAPNLFDIEVNHEMVDLSDLPTLDQAIKDLDLSCLNVNLHPYNISVENIGGHPLSCVDENAELNFTKP